MQRCLQLATMGTGQVAPNPMVGAVLVHEGRIIGEGYHQHYGAAHAEVNCINSVTDADKGLIAKSAMYVSLEPCVHFGKTPPCTDLIISNNIQLVIIGCRDSFEAVDGKGIDRLRTAGIPVIVGILEQDCLDQNKRFFTFHKKHRPFIILKWAQSSDGKIAASSKQTSLANANNSKKADVSRSMISNDLTNRLVHKWRTEEQAILVGTNTALLDDPQLTTRSWPGKDPLRLVIDSELKLPLHLKLFDGQTKTIVFNYRKQDDCSNLVYCQLKREENMLIQIMQVLYSLQIQSLVVEGGSKLLQSFIDDNLWDEIRVITNSAEIGEEGLDAPVMRDIVAFEEQQLKDDTIIFYKRKG